MLPYAVFMSLIAIMGMAVYRESTPIQPEPREMSATLITLAKFIQPDMYDSLTKWGALLKLDYPSPETCKVS